MHAHDIKALGRITFDEVELVPRKEGQLWAPKLSPHIFELNTVRYQQHFN